MAPVGLALVVVLALVGIAIVGYAMFAPRRRASEKVPVRVAEAVVREPLRTDTQWTHAAGEEFSGLAESARCDMVFAVAALDDDRSQQLLEHALDDPSEAVGLAAAHVLAGRGQTAVVERYLAGHPGERAERIAHALALLAPE